MVGGGWGGIRKRNIHKQLRPCRVELALEGIDGRGVYNRSGEPVPVFTIRAEKDDFLRRRRPGPCVSNQVRETGLHSELKMGPDQRFKNGGNRSARIFKQTTALP